MIFNSFEFAVFLPLVWGLYWSLRRHLRLQNLLVAAAQARGVEVVLVSTPWHADLVRACGEASADRFARRLSAFAAARQCRYVSFLRTAFPPSDWLDANHLNVRGAAKFTKLLAETLEKKGRTTNE